MFELNKIYNEDCLEYMDKLIEQCVTVDAIITDPPYGTTACKWDSVIPFDEMWQRLDKLIKPNGAIVLFGSEPFSSALRMSNIKNYKYDWVWNKDKGFGVFLAKKQPLRTVENILVFYKKQPIYNPQMQEGKPYTDKPRKRTMGIIDDAIGMKKAIENKGERYPSSVQKFSNGNNKTQHPTQKPLELMKYLIKTYSNESNMVLDNTMGAGTTCLAAKELNRKFIGIEKEPKYYEIACRRCGF